MSTFEPKNLENDFIEAKKNWEAMSWENRATIFLRAAELLAGKYRARDSPEQGHGSKDEAESRLGERLQPAGDPGGGGRVLSFTRMVSATRGVGAAHVDVIDHRRAECGVPQTREDLAPTLST